MSELVSDELVNLSLSHSGLRKLLLKYWQIGAVEMFRGVVVAAQVKKLQMYMPELRVCDVTRY